MDGYIYFEIQADEPERAIEFYEQVFGWEFTRDRNIPLDFWRIYTGENPGALMRRPASRPAPQTGTNAFVCSIKVDDFDETAKKVLDAGGEVALEKFLVSGVCWQGYFIDTEGNTFGAFQVTNEVEAKENKQSSSEEKV